MKALLLVILAAASAHADPPFFPRGTNTNQAMGGLNANFLDQTTQQRDRLTTTVTPGSCPAGQALTGAFFNNGYTFGGVCTASSGGASGSTVAVNSPLSGNGSAGSPVSVNGISSSCASGYILSPSTWTDGVTTGGACSLAPTGPTGPTGSTGPAGTVAVTSATAVSSTTAPGVYNIGVATAAVIGFYIPSGADGAKGSPGTSGTNGTNGTNGLLTFASDIAAYWVILSTSGAQTYALTVATDGALILTSTTTAAAFYAYPNATRKYLSNGSFTSLITADDSDGVLRMKPNTVTLRITDLAVYDAGNVVWDIGMDADGVIRTSNAGGL